MEDDDLPMSEAVWEGRLRESMSKMDPDAARALEQLIQWMAERPKNAPSLTQEEMHEFVSATRLEIIRRRLGGKTGQVLPFPGTASI